MMKAIKLTLIILVIGGLILALAILAVNMHMISFTSEYIFDSMEMLKDPQGADTVIVPGAYVFDNGTPCPMLEDRLKTGLAVFAADYAKTMLLSGDHGTKGYDEVNSMKTYVFNNGIDKQNVFLDHAGFSTYDSVVRAKKVFLVESAVITTQEYHLIRAVYIARKTGIDAYGVKADLRKYPRSEMARYLVREWLARFKDFIYVNILKPGPVYLGKEIPITGSSLPSYDKPEDLVK